MTQMDDTCSVYPTSPVILSEPQASRRIRPLIERRKIWIFIKFPLALVLALSANTAAMNYYAHLPEEKKQEILGKAHNVRSEQEMYTLVANLANGQLQ